MAQTHNNQNTNKSQAHITGARHAQSVSGAAKDIKNAGVNDAKTSDMKHKIKGADKKAPKSSR